MFLYLRYLECFLEVLCHLIYTNINLKLCSFIQMSLNLIIEDFLKSYIYSFFEYYYIIRKYLKKLSRTLHDWKKVFLLKVISFNALNRKYYKFLFFYLSFYFLEVFWMFLQFERKCFKNNYKVIALHWLNSTKYEMMLIKLDNG